MASGSRSFKVPSGQIAVIRAFSYQVRPAVAFTVDQLNRLTGSFQIAILVDGVGQPGLGLEILGTPGASQLWPPYLMEQECWIVCPDSSTVTLIVSQLNVGDTVDFKFYGNLLPTHGLPPDFEIASMGNLGLVPTGSA